MSDVETPKSLLECSRISLDDIEGLDIVPKNKGTNVGSFLLISLPEEHFNE